MISKNLVDERHFIIPDKLSCDNLQASKLRNDILEGIQNVIAGKTQLFSGDLRLDMKKHASLDKDC